MTFVAHPASSPLPGQAAPRSVPDREIRFAVVMYGGVSLAIYMNGIAQELLRLVRATAPASEPGADGTRIDTGEAMLGDDQLRSTEHVYRRIARSLRADGDWSHEALRDAGPGDAIRGRFVIDILSGTSAGGINAVFLAKALATGGGIDALADLWIEEGAIEKLINDRHSAFDGVRHFDQPTSLLNSRRMYRKLVDAMDEMDEASERVLRERPDLPTPSALVREVDLFVTATDIHGLPIVLRLADRVVAERRHRNVFHFRYSDGTDGAECNDFARGCNPILAFGARCTSSFPVAFEPMTLADIDDVLSRRGARIVPPRVEPDGSPWRRFFPAYVGRPDGYAGHNDPDWLARYHRSAEPWLQGSAVPLADRAFGDGGYLDNKPFDYAIGALAGRSAGMHVDRKLLYLEPSPGRDVIPHDGDARPDAIANAMAALSLARYETIRQDLERVLERNRVVDRVSRVLQGIDSDLTLARDSGNTGGYSMPDYANADLADLIAMYGSAYGGYHRLKVSALTDEIAEYIARAAGFNEKSDEFQAVQNLVGAWRSRWYAPFRSHRGREGAAEASAHAFPPFDRDRFQPGANVHSETAFLLRYDLNYRIRRLGFVLTRIDELLRNPDGALARQRLDLAPDQVTRAEFEDRLRELRDGLAPWLRKLRERRFRLLARAPDHEAAQPPDNLITMEVSALPISRADVLRVLRPTTTNARRGAALALIDEKGLHAPLAALEAQLGAVIGDVTRRAAERIAELLPKPATQPASDDGWATAHYLVHAYYSEYELYDQLVFPASFATDIGQEVDVVDVLRLSPDDAPSLIDEQALTEPRRKLAGNALAHFGAFLDRSWRWNDIMWGRLDAAERLITVLLPGEEAGRSVARQRLIDEAHGIILEEEFAKLDASAGWATDVERDEIRRLLLLARSETGVSDERRALRESVRRAVRDHYHIPVNRNREATANTVARGTRVVGRMLQHMGQRHALQGRAGAWIARIGAIGWGLVEAAVPQSFGRFLAMFWLKILYLVEAVIAALGFLFGNPAMRNFGLLAFGITALANVLVLLVGDLLVYRTSLLRRVLIATVLALGVALGIGATAALDAGLRAGVLELARGADGLVTLLKGFLIAAVVSVAGIGAVWLEARRRVERRVARELDQLREAVKNASRRRTGTSSPATDDLVVPPPRGEERRKDGEVLPYDRRTGPSSTSAALGADPETQKDSGPTR